MDQIHRGGVLRVHHDHHGHHAHLLFLHDRHGRGHRGHLFSYGRDRHDRPLYAHLLFLHGHDHRDHLFSCVRDHHDHRDRHGHQKYFSL